MLIEGYILAILIGYLLGSLSFGAIVAKYKNIDIFKAGSGNPGATNVKRVIGHFWGNIVFILDFFKGYLAVLIASLIIPLLLADNPNYDTSLIDRFKVLTLFAAIIGHSFSIYIGFRGGKGVATTMGGLMFIMYKVLLVGLIAWIICFLISRIVSLSSIIFSLSLPISVSIIYPNSKIYFYLTVIISLIVVIRHYENIKRMIFKKEHRF